MRSRTIGTILASFIVGALVMAMIPAVAHHRPSSRRLSKRVTALSKRIAVIENAPDTVTGVADEIANLDNRVSNHGDSLSYLFGVTGQLGSNGRYYGNVDRFQVVLPDNDACVNGQPRNAVWNNSHLAC